MYLKITIGLIIFSFALPYLYDREQVIESFFRNAPDKLKKFSTFKEYEVKFADRLRNCEDALLDEAMGLAILSCDVGRDKWNTVMGNFHKEVPSGALYIYDYSNPDLSDDEALKRLTLADFPSGDTDFHPLGIEYYMPTSTLYVVNHARTGSTIEIFRLSVSSFTATHVRTLRHPLVHTPNSIAAISDMEIYFTNDHYFPVRKSPLLAKAETFLAVPGGSVVHIDLTTDSARSVAHIPFANGIAVLNETTLAVSSSSKPGIYIYAMTKQRDLVLQKVVRVPSLVDNISVDENGKLLIAGHPHVPSFLTVSGSRALCNSEKQKESESEVCKVRAPSWVGEWTEDAGLTELYQGLEYETSSTAIRDAKRGVGIVTGLYAKGIMVWKE
ncbi:putative paraoxonase [Glonium stellatum]|uniref:Putative paraoxonase n=1 Tax=Glonium stellatum TaxID=574774 RepID=A0A8E2JMN8_9PEZI|nr:putative paraoxonase [Glonium stellatum]